MIKKLKYNEIDFNKYKKCLENSVQNSDYAERKFLDIVSDKKWFLLVYNDYEAVMPVSFVVKFGIKIVLMPKLCQQLGVFSKEDNKEINTLFLEFLEKNFLVLFYAFNGDNQFQKKLKKKTSYILKKNNYEEVKKNYSVHRRRNVRIIGELIDNINIRKSLIESDSEFIIKNMKGTKKPKDNHDYFKLFTKLIQEKIGLVRIFEFKNTTQSMVYLFEGKRNFYLSLFINNFPVINTNFPSIMIDQCLQELISEKNFDFMGSEVENVAKFNERFGAESYQYPVIEKTKQEVLKKILQLRFI